jgi:integrase/recombinase XerD
LLFSIQNKEFNAITIFFTLAKKALIMNLEAKIITHRVNKRIAVYFEKNAALIARIKETNGARWSQSLLAWYLPDTDENRVRFKIIPLSQTIPSAEGIEQIEKFKQWLRSKRYSESSISTYSDALKSFFVFYNIKPIAQITNEDVIIYNNEYILKNKLSASYQNQIVNAVKLYFKTIKNTKIEVDKIHRPKRAKVLPNVLSKESVIGDFSRALG